jgi:hypothetical protein
MRNHDISVFVHKADGVNFVGESDFSDHLLVAKALDVIGSPDFHKTALTARHNQV